MDYCIILGGINYNIIKRFVSSEINIIHVFLNSINLKQSQIKQYSILNLLL